MKTRILEIIIAIGTLATASHAQVVGTHFQATAASSNNYFMGKVGVGTNNPQMALHVMDDFDTRLLIENNAAAGGGAGFDIYGSAGANSYRWRATVTTTGFKLRDHLAGRDVLFLEAGAPASSLYVKSTGSVGIGNAAPASKLHVSGDIKADTQITAASAIRSLSGYSYFMDRTGIGTNSPSTMLHLVDDADTRLTIENNGASGGCGFDILGSSTANQFQWRVTADSSQFKIRDHKAGRDILSVQTNAPAGTLVLASSGKVGIATAAPTETLHVAGAGRFDQGVVYVAALGDLSMGSFTNKP